MIRIGILGGADIAYRMFIPALQELEDIVCVGIASRSSERRKRFREDFDIPTYENYEDILDNPEVDSVYIPLPPALHYKWAKIALEKGKNVYLEKPSTSNYSDALELAELAKSKNLILQENYMFQYHSQLLTIRGLIEEGRVGKINLIKSSFGFPLRDKEDFRYNKELGGGALLDAGGYVTKLATLLLGNTIEVTGAEMNSSEGYQVDMFGTVTFKNNSGLMLQGSYGMDCYYQCNLEIWGSKGKITTNRIFTAPANYVPTIFIEDAEGRTNLELTEDRHFVNAIHQFVLAHSNKEIRYKMLRDLILQAKLINDIRLRWE